MESPHEVKLYQHNQNRPSVERCAKCHPSAQKSWTRSRTLYLGSTKTRSVLHSKRNKLGGCYIVPTGSRHVVLAGVHAKRALAFGRVDIGFAAGMYSVRFNGRSDLGGTSTRPDTGRSDHGEAPARPAWDPWSPLINFLTAGRKREERGSKERGI